MNLRHIEIFHAVYVNGSVSAAARALNVSQPSVSKMLRHAESLLGFPLFQRTNGGLVPTEDAHSLFADVREIQDRVQALREAGRNIQPRHRHAAHLWRCRRWRSRRIPTAVSQFLRSHANVKFDLQTVHHDDLLRKLHERETDIAIAYQVPPSAPISQRWLGEGELVVLYREQDMPDAPPSAGARAACAASASSASPPAARSASSSPRSWSGAASSWTRSSRCAPSTWPAALVRQGVGMTVVDSFTAQACLAPGLSMRPLKPRITFDIHAMFLINRPPGALADDFLKTLKRVLDAP